MDNPLDAWLHSTGKMVKDSKLQNVTHLMLNGGKMDISNDHEEFQKLYSKYIKYKNYIVEKKTDFFKFFIDFDILSEVIINLEQYINIIQSTLSSLYKTNELLCIVTGANKNKEIIKENKKYIKQGFHLHWPGIIVNKETAKCIRKNLIVNLTNVFGKDIKHYDTWEKIIDRCVYETNGLRLVGSDKCTMADGIPVAEKRIYILMDVYIGTNKDESRKDFYESNTLQLIKDTSIRCDANSITDVHNLGDYIESEEPIKTSDNQIHIQKGSSEYKSIEKFFKLHAAGYKVEDIRSIRRIKDKPMFLIYSKSKFCQNIQHFHSNNHIYFKLTPSGLCQKCLSESTGVHGPCREYQSMYVPITTALESSLKWKKPKPKNDEIKKQENFSLPGILENIENKLTAKQAFKGPGKKK
jgi:hypothetical protein